MAYSINKTDGTILATVADGQVDNLSSDLTLIGKNYSGFGEALNENFVKLLENFSNNQQPPRPVRGQIWFDTTELKLKVYNGLGFVPVSSATIASTQPLNLGVGDLWFNDVDKQLYFYDGVSTILLGPDYSVSQGISGLRVANILDSLNQNRVITYLYTNGVLLGIFSKDSFTPKIPIEGFTGNINPGFNAGNLAGLKFNVTATNAEQLGNQPASSYVRSDTSNIINGQIIISSNLGLIIGDANQGQIQIQDGNLLIANIASEKDISLLVRKGALPETALKITSSSRTVGIYSNISDSQVDIGGNLTVGGDLVVNGDLTTINTSTLTIEDKNIELAKTDTPTDEFADGGGMILKGTNTTVTMENSSIAGTTLTVGTSSGDVLEGMVLSGTGVTAGTYVVAKLSGTGEGSGTTWQVTESQTVGPITITGTKSDHRFTWNNSGDEWFSTEHINLASGRALKIGGVTVIDGNSLGSGITSIPGVTSFGAQTELTVDDMFFDNSTIEVTAADTNLDLIIDGIGALNLGGKKIINVQDPTGPQDAATKEYVDNAIEARNLYFSLDISDGISNAGIATLLGQIAPVNEYRVGTIARVLCTFSVNSTTILDINAVYAPTPILVSTPSGSAFAINNIAFSPATVPAPGISISRIVKTYEIVQTFSGLVWQFIS
jgi:hypothetical protein